MKKKLGGCCFALLCLLTSCTATSTVKTESDLVKQTGVAIASSYTEPIQKAVDRTVPLKDSFTVNPDFVVRPPNSSGQLVACFNRAYSNIGELYKSSDYIVYGTVSKVEYADTNAIARTKLDFKIDKSLKGDLQAGDLISVIESGGYVRMKTFIETYGTAHLPNDASLEQLETEILEECSFGAPMSAVGDRYVLCLGTCDVSGNVGTGAYSCIGDFQGKYCMDSQGLLSRYCPPGEPNFYFTPTSPTPAEQPMTLDSMIERIGACTDKQGCQLPY